MLTGSVAPSERGRMQGLNDLIVFGGVTLASLSSGRLDELLGLIGAGGMVGGEYGDAAVSGAGRWRADMAGDAAKSGMIRAATPADLPQLVALITGLAAHHERRGHGDRSDRCPRCLWPASLPANLGGRGG